MSTSLLLALKYLKLRRSAVSVITLLFCLTKHISRVEGAVMVLLYAATMVFAVVR